MMGLGLFGWLVVAGILFVLPLWKIYERVGLDPRRSLFALIPVAGVPLALGFLAFMKWPNGARPVPTPFQVVKDMEGKF